MQFSVQWSGSLAARVTLAGTAPQDASALLLLYETRNSTLAVLQPQSQFEYAIPRNAVFPVHRRPCVPTLSKKKKEKKKSQN